MRDFLQIFTGNVVWGEGGKFDICRLDHSGLGQLLFS